MTTKSPSPRGYLMLMAVVFGAVFLSVIGALSSFVLIDNKLQAEQTDKNRALAIAEAGIEYYRWHLAHFATDMQNGTGLPGPYTISYNDPEGATTGSYTLNITGNSSCNQLTSVDITSKGKPTNSNTTATISARYARPTVGQYSYIVNDSVWAGADRVILGPYHSNGGVRMDGTANSPVTSSLASWSCTSSYGCTPTATKTGVFGAGTNQNLWSYPTPQVDFSAISANFTALKTIATASGLFFATNGTANASRGYHFIFNGNGTVTVKQVNSTLNIQSLPVDGTSQAVTTDYTVISSETLLGTYTIPVNCGLIFVEDDIWVEGTINQKVTLVAADVTHVGVAPNANLRGNLTYTAYNGSAGLTLIAENDVLVTADSPNTMTLNGIFVAQGGAFGRNLYRNNSLTDCNLTYEPRTSLTILGTTVSNKRTGTKWLNGCANGNDAGYQTRIDSYDRRISTNPPPFTPYTSTDYSFLDWRQK